MNSTTRLLLVIALACAPVNLRAASSGGSFDSWLKHRDASAADASVVRFYSFEDARDAETPLANFASKKDSPLKVRLERKKGAPVVPLRVVEGRWPQKRALRLDQAYLVAASFAVSNKTFSVSAWVRLNGPGSIRGNNESTNGGMFSIGSGYWDGFRITASYPRGKIGFEIGRPKPSHCIGIQSTDFVADAVWHQIVASWDGKVMSLFIDGILSCSEPYTGEYTPATGAPFRIGYANAGLGSVVLDVDEVVVYNRALTAQEVLRAVELCGPNAPGVQRNLASVCIAKNDLAGAREHYRALLALPGVNVRSKLDAFFDVANISWQLGDGAATRSDLQKIASSADAPAIYKSVAQLRIAGSYIAEKNYKSAKAEYEKVAVIADAPPHHKAEAADRIKQIERTEKGLPARDPLASRSQPKFPTPAFTLFVSAKGSDKNLGSREKPFATLERARDEIRAMKRRGAVPAGGVTVFVREGTYPVTQTFKLAAEDSGTEQSPIVYAAFGKESPRFTGGQRVNGFSRIKDATILAQLPEESRSRVWQAALKAQGITDFGKFEPAGYSSGRGFRTHPMLEVFFNGQPLEISRWPNNGFVETGTMFGPEEKDRHGRAVSRGGQFEYDGDRPNRWKAETDVWLYGYWYHDWADSYEKVASIDTTKKQITLAPPLHHYGFAKGRRYCAVNLLSEIDRPGEWYLDREKGVLYLWPPSNPNRADVQVSMFSQYFADLDDVSHVSLRGLTWEYGRADGIRIQRGQHCLVAGCTVRRFAGDGVLVAGGSGHGLLGCDVYAMGRGGVVLRGGDRKILQPSGHFIENCNIHTLSRIDHTYTPAILANGVGIRIAHNFIHHIGSSAMRVEGNDNLVELNDVFEVVRESDDQGGVDVFGNPTYRGNVYRHNFFHDIGSGRSCGQAGIRLDDAISGTLIYGNVFSRCSDGGFGGVQIHGGKDNWVDNNLFVECKKAISFSPWGQKRWDQFLSESMASQALKEVDITKPPYSTRYPELATLREDADVNHVWRNMAVNCGRFLYRDRGVVEAVANVSSKASTRIKRLCDGRDSLVLTPIPFDEIGLYEDVFRARPLR